MVKATVKLVKKGARRRVVYDWNSLKEQSAEIIDKRIQGQMMVKLMT
jgi:hypothetical protein